MAITILGGLAVGSVVKIKENGVAVNYIIIHKGVPDSSFYDSSCDDVWVMREKTLPGIVWDNDRNDYENSDIHAWLNRTFLNTIDSKTYAAIKRVKIPFHKGTDTTLSGVQSGSNGLYCRVFLLSAQEVYSTSTWGDNRDGARLSYFTSSERNKANDENNNSVGWWTRTPARTLAGQSGIRVYAVNGSANIGNNNISSSLGVRPVFILPWGQGVDSNGNLVFNTAPTISGSSYSGCIFMAVDYITGLIVAGVFKKSEKTETGGLESRAGWKGLCRKGVTLIVVLVAARLDLVIGSTVIKDGVVIAFIANETISIVENAGLMGIPIPGVIMRAIDVLKKKADTDDRKDGK